MGDHLSLETAQLIDAAVGIDHLWLNERSSEQLERLFATATGPTGAALRLSFIDIASAAEASSSLLAAMFAHCFEWDDVWQASDALDHDAVDASVVAAAVDAFCVHVPGDGSPVHRCTMTVVLTRLAQTGLLQTEQIDRLAGTSFACAELLQAALTQWRQAEAAALEAAFSTEHQAPAPPKLSNTTPLSSAVARYVSDPADDHLLAILGSLPHEGGIAVRIALRRIHGIAADHGRHVEMVRRHSAAAAAMWNRLDQRARARQTASDAVS